MSKYKPKDFIKPAANYIRVGVDYFKIIEKEDRYGIVRNELKKWKKEEITLDHDRKILYEIPKYDDFILKPDNKNYNREEGSFFNLYAPFTHRPKKGKWYWTEVLLRHIFGEQYEVGIQYLQCLYLHPTQALPVLILVSKERQTGKSTFIDWLMTLFGANMVIITPSDLSREFNGSYSRANIIAIEETLIEKNQIVEKIKALSTQKMINANLKNVNDFQIPFYGKIIMASNNERKFMKIDQDEIRFFVRKICTPPIENHNILNDMVSEIPAFIDHLESLPPVDRTKSRMVFTVEQLLNDTLTGVKSESHTWLYKEMKAYFQDMFNNQVVSGRDYVLATPKEIKEYMFDRIQNVTSSFIRDVLIDEFKFKRAPKNISYKPLAMESFKTGQPYKIEKGIIFSQNGVKTDENSPENEDDEILKLAENDDSNEIAPF
jgi:hypothetical protein